jgi:hypothetical protein
LLQQTVDQRRLAMVDVRDNGDVAKFFGWVHGGEEPAKGGDYIVRSVPLIRISRLPAVSELPKLQKDAFFIKILTKF